MVRITLYDPKISAEVYSQRRKAEQGFDSGVATGLARLGRALTERERGNRAANSEAVALRAAMGFWEEEVRRLDKLGAKIPPGKPGFHDMAMKEHLAERDRRIAALKEAHPDAVEVFDRHTQPLTGVLEHRAGVMESVAIGEGLAGALEGAMTEAVRAAKTDPLQHDAILERFDDALAAIEANGIVPEGVAGTRQAARRNVGMAAVDGLIADGEFEAARELLAEDRLPGLAEEDRTQLGRRLDRAEAKAAAEGEAETAAGIDAYWAGFEGLQETLRTGGEAPDVDYADETIRRVLPADQAEKMIALRTEAEDAGDGYGRIVLASPDAIDALIADAPPDEARHLRAAARERERRLAEDPAAYVLGNARVRAMHDAMLAAVESGDAAAIATSSRAFVRASAAEQRRLGVREADRRVLPAEMAADMVAEFMASEQPDPSGLGAGLRERFGDQWRPVLEDLKRHGLPDGMAAIAAMDRPDQQAAAKDLSTSVGISTADLRGRIAESEAEAVDQALRAAVDVEGDASAALTKRRAYRLVGSGEDATTAVTMAIAEITANSTTEVAALRQSVPKRLAAASKPPADDRSDDFIEAALPSASEVDDELAMVDEIAALAERLGLDPAFLPPDSEALLGVLRGLDQFESLTEEQQRQVDFGIRRFQSSPIESWLPLRERYWDRRREARLRAAELEAERSAAEPAENALLLENRVEELRNGPEDARLALSRRRIAGMGPQWWTGLSDEVRKANIDWLNEAITGGDDLDREFAVKAVLEADQQSFDIRQILSDDAMRSYVDFWRSSYEAGPAIDASDQSNSSMRFKDLSDVGRSAHDLPISHEVYRELLARISQVPHASREERKALVEFIGNVVTPFNEVHGLNLQAVVGALSVSKEDGIPQLIEIPGPFVEFLTTRDLADYHWARGLQRLHRNQEPHEPDSIWEHIGLLGFSGAALSASSLLTDLSAGSIVGATHTVLDIANTVEEHDREVGDYYTRREVYWRLQLPGSSKVMTAEMDRLYPRPEEIPPMSERTGETITGDTSLQR